MPKRSVAKRRTINVPGLLLFLTLAVGGVLADGPVVAQTNYEPSAEGLQARRAFQDAKFGMFIHWGVYTVQLSGGNCTRRARSRQQSQQTRTSGSDRRRCRSGYDGAGISEGCRIEHHS